jgi:hypothetical protein
MNSYKKLLLKLLAALMVFCILTISLFYVYDPLQVYHTSWVTKKSHFMKKMRLQDAGIINNYDYDSIILGTSMLDFTSEKEASSKLKSNFVNLSIPGGNLYERSVILKQALKKKKLKHVIYSLDTGWDLNLQRHNKKYPIDNFDFLYDNNPLNDLKVYWNDKYVKCLLTFSLSEECLGTERNITRSDFWFKRVGEMHAHDKGIHGWISNKKSKNIFNHTHRRLEKPLKEGKAYDKRLIRTHKIINKNLLTYVKRNRKTQFHIIFPPYSRFLFAVWRQKDYQKYKLYIETLRYVVKNSLKYDNLKVYAFDDLDYLDDLMHYTDSRHYGPEMNSLFLDYIQKEKYFKTEEALEQFIVKIDEKNNAYNIEGIIKTLDEAHKILVTIEKKKIAEKTVEVKGWIMANRATRVELWQDKKKLKSMRLTLNKVIFEKYPQYKLKNNSFAFHKTINSRKNLKLVFKYKRRVIKKVYLTNEMGEESK